MACLSLPDSLSFSSSNSREELVEELDSRLKVDTFTSKGKTNYGDHRDHSLLASLANI